MDGGLLEANDCIFSRVNYNISSVVSVAITVNIVRGIGLDIGTLRAQYQRTLILSYWGSNRTTGIGIKVF